MSINEIKEILTVELAKEYHRKSMLLTTHGHDIGENRRLRVEMQQRFGVTELEAINILNGFHIAEYVQKYERPRNSIEIKYAKEDQNEILIEQVITEVNDWLFDRIEELERELYGQ